MNYSLQRAADELKDDIKKYSILVDYKSSVIGWKDKAIQLSSSTSREICKRYIRSYIKQAKAEVDAKHSAKQGSLFDTQQSNDSIVKGNIVKNNSVLGEMR